MKKISCTKQRLVIINNSTKVQEKYIMKKKENKIKAIILTKTIYKKSRKQVK